MGEEDLKAGAEEKEDGDKHLAAVVGIDVDQVKGVEVNLDLEEEKVVEEQQEHEVKDVEEYVSRLNDDKWPEVNGVYDDKGEWHDWNEMTYSYTYGETELIILPYTVCSINLAGSQQLAASPTT